MTKWILEKGENINIIIEDNKIVFENLQPNDGLQFQN